MKEYLDALRALEEAMTPGEWTTAPEGRVLARIDDDYYETADCGGYRYEADARGIAVLRNLAGPLLEYVAAADEMEGAWLVGSLAERLARYRAARTALRDALRREMGGE